MGGVKFICPGTMLCLGGCIHGEGYLKGVALQPEPVLGPGFGHIRSGSSLMELWGKAGDVCEMVDFRSLLYLIGLY